MNTITGWRFAGPWITAAGLALAAVTSADAFDHDDYKLEYHQSGEMRDGYVPGMATRSGQGHHTTTANGGFSVFTAQGLFYFVERGQVTIYRPGEGIWTRLSYHTKFIKDEIDGTKTVDFSRWPDKATHYHPTIFAIRHPDVIKAWDEALRDPARWVRNYGMWSKTELATYKGGPVHIKGAEVRLKYFGVHDAFEEAEQYLRTAAAETAVPDIQRVRAEAAQWDNREAQDRAATTLKSQASQNRRGEILQQAASRFASSSASIKEVGMTVCSSDNRLGYVEQVAGPRIKILLKGRAVGNYGEFGEFGPFDLDDTGMVDLEQARPITDANFLFRPLTKQVRFANHQELIWDEGRYWAACEYR